MAEHAETKEYPWQGRQFRFEVVAETEEGLKKRGTFVEPEHLGEFVVYSDEGENLGGGNTAPTPIGYFLLGAGFCTLTQLSRYSKMMKVGIRSARIVVRSSFRTDGSVLKETVKGSTLGFEMDIEVESDDPPERVAALVRNAENGCYVMQAIRNPTEVSRSVRLNGAPIDVDALRPAATAS